VIGSQLSVVLPQQPLDPVAGPQHDAAPAPSATRRAASPYRARTVVRSSVMPCVSCDEFDMMAASIEREKLMD
jgi:hypothetical protein